MDKIVLSIVLIIDIIFLMSAMSKKKWNAPCFLFSAIWIIILLIYIFVESKWISIDFETSMVIFVGNVVFLAFAYIFSYKKNKYNNANKLMYYEKKNNQDTINYKSFFFLGIIFICMNLPRVLDSFYSLRSGLNFNDININNIINGNLNAKSTLSTIVNMLVVRPFLYASIPVFAIELFKTGKKKMWVIILEVLIIAFNIFNGGKRSVIVYLLIVCFVVAIQNWRWRISYKQKIVLFCMSCLALGIVTWISQQRDTSIFSSASVYLAGCIPSLGVRIKSVDSYYFGLGALHGVLVPFFIGLHGVLKINYPTWWVELDSLIEAADYVSIGGSRNINAFNSLFYTAYVDGGIIFVIIEMAILGYICGTAYSNFVTKSSVRNTCIYSVLCIGIVCSMYTLYFTQYPYALSFIYIYLLTYDKKLSKKRGHKGGCS